MARVRGASASQELRKKAGSGKFLQVSDGDEFEIAFVGVLRHGLEGDKGEPFGTEVVWVEGSDGRYSVEFDPAIHDEDDTKPTWFWNVLVRGNAEDGSEDEVKILQQGVMLFDQWIKHKDKKGYGYWFTLSREGGGQFNTKYSLEREDPIDEDDLEDIKNYDLHDLEAALDEQSKRGQESSGRKRPKERKPRRTAGRRRKQESAPEGKAEPKPDAKTEAKPEAKTNGAGESNGELSENQRQALKEALQALPDPSAGQAAFKSRFGVTKLRDLHADKFEDAKLFLQSIAQGEAEDDDTDDPFLD